MSALYKNMSAPPVSVVEYAFLSTSSKYIVISPYVVASYLKSSMKNLTKNLEKYTKNKEEALLGKTPQSFVIVDRFITNSHSEAIKITSRLLENYSLDEEYDMDTSIIILSKIVGDLYIPNRKPYFDEEKLSYIYLIPEDQIQ